MSTVFLFGYGSNLLDSQMHDRCPEGKFIGVGYIKGYKLVYDDNIPCMNGGAINSIPSKGEIIWGTVYEVNQHDFSRMDSFEEYPKTYQRKETTVCLRDGRQVEAYFYYKNDPKIGKPGKEYLDIVLKGARQHNLPEEYVQKYLLQTE